MQFLLILRRKHHRSLLRNLLCSNKMSFRRLFLWFLNSLHDTWFSCLFLTFMTLCTSKKNVTKFLKRFNEQYQEHCVNNVDKFRKLSRYCEKLMSNFIKIISVWVNQNWKKLIQIMKKKYELKNSKQQMNSFHFLKIFKNRSHIEKNNFRVYSRQFRAINMKLHSVEQINKFIICRWYLQDLFEFTRAKIIKKHFVDFLSLKL